MGVVDKERRLHLRQSGKSAVTGYKEERRPAGQLRSRLTGADAKAMDGITKLGS